MGLRNWLTTIKSEQSLHYASEDSEIAQLCDKLPSLQGSIALSWPLSYPHISTVYSALTHQAKVLNVTYKRYLLHQADGGNNALDFAIPSIAESPRTLEFSEKEAESLGDDKEGVLVLMHHGIHGSSKDQYVRATAAALLHHSPETIIVAFNARGCGRTKLTSGTWWSASYIDDFAPTIAYLRSRFSKRKIVLIGFSIGANLVCKFLGTCHADIDLAISISNPWDIGAIDKHLHESYMGLLYSRGLAYKYKQGYRRHAAALARDNLNSSDIEKCTYHHDIDDVLYHVLLGFESREEYYTTASSRRYLHNVDKPLLIINALDDPITGSSMIPYEAIKNENIALVTTDYGGHLGWYQHDNGRWFTKVICEAVNAM